MTKSQIIKAILAILNMRGNITFPVLKKFLQKNSLCRYMLICADGKKCFSLLTHEEIEALPEELTNPGRVISNHEIPFFQAIELKWAHHLHTIGAPASLETRIVFPDDMNQDSGEAGHEQAVSAFLQVAVWFRSFINSCQAGNMDIAALNKFQYLWGLRLEFQPSQDPLNPVLNVAEVNNSKDDLIERKILSVLVYPFIFSNKGKELSTFKQCRQCGTYFKGERKSATYCSDPCRMAFHYLNTRR